MFFFILRNHNRFPSNVFLSFALWRWKYAMEKEFEWFTRILTYSLSHPFRSRMNWQSIRCSVYYSRYGFWYWTSFPRSYIISFDWICCCRGYFALYRTVSLSLEPFSFCLTLISPNESHLTSQFKSDKNDNQHRKCNEFYQSAKAVDCIVKLQNSRKSNRKFFEHCVHDTENTHYQILLFKQCWAMVFLLVSWSLFFPIVAG